LELAVLNMLDYFNGTKTLDEIGNNMLDSLKNAFVVSNENIIYYLSPLWYFIRREL